MRLWVIGLVLIVLLGLAGCTPNSPYADCRSDCLRIYGNCTWDFASTSCYDSRVQDNITLAEFCLNKCID